MKMEFKRSMIYRLIVWIIFNLFMSILKIGCVE